MTKREKILAIAGAVILAGSFAGLVILLRSTRAEWPESTLWAADYAASSRAPKVMLGYDGDGERIKNAIRIDVRGGVPHTRGGDGVPIADLAAYVDSEAERTGAQWVVVSASSEERIGVIITILDHCRKAHVKAIILNQSLDAFASK